MPQTIRILAAPAADTLASKGLGKAAAEAVAADIDLATLKTNLE